MRVLTLIQPYATLVAIGAKKFETRSWQTSPGPLAIHAGKGYPPQARAFARSALVARALAKAGLTADTLPTGVIVATCTVNSLTPTGAAIHAFALSEDEIYFGEFHAPGRWWAWELRDVVPLAAPIPAAGKQGLWQFDLQAALAA